MSSSSVASFSLHPNAVQTSPVKGGLPLLPSPDKTHEGVLEVQAGTSWLHTSAPSSWLTPDWVTPIQQ